MTDEAIRASVCQSRITALEFDITLGTRASWNGTGRTGLIYCHGAGNTALTAYSYGMAGLALINGLARAFTVCVADLGGDVWGNSTHVARIEAVRAYLVATLGCPPDVVLVSASMGALGALAYTKANPDKVRAVAGILPALDLNDLHANNRGPGATASINTAYGGAYNDVTDGPTHSPVQFAAALPSALPVAVFTASDDAVCVPSTATAFVTARPQTARTDVGALGHTEAGKAAAIHGVTSFVGEFA